MENDSPRASQEGVAELGWQPVLPLLTPLPGSMNLSSWAFPKRPPASP